ncbi:protein kinase [Kribbella sp. NPDC050820]|uniref:serine/threonine-protein kinase n=1 Tax=Kribbella sp. NPDC050820 TaxID=3155408 RepID=UPI003410F11E
MEAFAGRYRLIDLIGTGGMGSVWRAWDLRRSAYVAAKVLGQHDAATLLRFVREQSLRIDHPHVVAPHGWAADDDKVVFAMDLVRGGSVATLLGDHGPLPTSYVAVLLDQLLHGLSAVHAAGVVHRDLKPANLLLDATGKGRPHLRLSDFGIAGLLDEPRMTRHSTILGTPGYLAPEQLAGADPDPRQDLYTVGAVAAELLTGERPGTDGKLPPVEGPLADFIHRSTAPDPTRRPTTAHAAGRLLAESGALPPTNTTPWSTHPDSPEVFDQLPPLPPPWTPTGPAPKPSAPAGTPSPATPSPTNTDHQPAAPTHTAAIHLTSPPSPHPTAAPTPTASAATTNPNPARPTSTQSHPPDPAAPSPTTSSSPTVSSSTTTAPHSTPASPSSPAPHGSPAPHSTSTSPGTPASPATATAPSTPASPTVTPTQGTRPRNRPLVWLASLSLTGGLALLATAAWLLLS